MGRIRRSGSISNLPAEARDLPVLLHVHGGGWAHGDKAGAGLDNKLAHWLARGYAVASINYRMLPGTPPAGQAQDVASALAALQAQAPRWGLDPARVVLSGHSAGAHLVALLGADPSLLSAAGAIRPSGALLIDSAALDVPSLMSRRRVPPLFREAFGDDDDAWRRLSPLHRLTAETLPMLVVCASGRRIPVPPCEEGRSFVQRARERGVDMRLLPVALDHARINRELGLPSAYTDAVDRFLDGLLNDPVPAGQMTESHLQIMAG